MHIINRNYQELSLQKFRQNEVVYLGCKQSFELRMFHKFLSEFLLSNSKRKVA